MNHPIKLLIFYFLLRVLLSFFRFNSRCWRCIIHTSGVQFPGFPILLIPSFFLLSAASSFFLPSPPIGLASPPMAWAGLMIAPPVKRRRLSGLGPPSGAFKPPQALSNVLSMSPGRCLGKKRDACNIIQGYANLDTLFSNIKVPVPFLYFYEWIEHLRVTFNIGSIFFRP